MFYPVESYDQHNSAATRTVAIYTEPQRGNSGTCPIITEGWLGTTNDWYRQALGEFETLEQAVAAIAEDGFTVQQDLSDDDCEDGVVARYRTVEDAREQWPAADWLAPIRGELGITAETTDAEIDALVDELETQANEATDTDRPYGATLTGLLHYLRDLREEAR